MAHLVGAYLAGNAKNEQNWPSSPRDDLDQSAKIRFMTCTFRKHTFGGIEKNGPKN
jgi:hypothetical protein